MYWHHYYITTKAIKKNIVQWKKNLWKIKSELFENPFFKHWKKTGSEKNIQNDLPSNLCFKVFCKDLSISTPLYHQIPKYYKKNNPGHGPKFSY